MRYFIVLGLFLWTIIQASGLNPSAEVQISVQGSPYSFLKHLELRVPQTVLPPLDLQALDLHALPAEKQADQARWGASPFRYGTQREVDLSLANSGLWERLPNGDRLWRLRIKSTDARSIGLIYDEFFIPPGADLFVYDPDYSVVRGGFTSKDNKKHLRFRTGPIPGDEAVLEFYEPARVRGLGLLSIERVIHGYRGPDVPTEQSISKAFDFGRYETTCNKPAWDRDKRAVVLVDMGGTTCTGTLMNTTEEGVYTPYVLTALHCSGNEPVGQYYVGVASVGERLNWEFTLNHEYCSDTPPRESIVGAEVVAVRTNLFGGSDMLLLRLDDVPPARAEAYYAGWDSRDVAPKDVYGIHHPEGLTKKFSRDENWISDPSNPWPGKRITAEWDDPWPICDGSSGSGLFNQDHRVIGQLWGRVPWFVGEEDCAGRQVVWYGRLAHSWDSGTDTTSLRPWLAPGSSASTLDGKWGPLRDLEASVSGDAALNPYEYGRWTAAASGGMTPYTYDWQWRPVLGDPLTWHDANQHASGSRLDMAFTESSYVKVEIGSNDAQTVEPLWYVQVPSKRRRGNSATSLHSTYSLEPNYPNPFNPSTEIAYRLPHEAHVRLTVYDAAGREVRRLLDEVRSAGRHRITFTAAGLPSGSYFYEMRSGEFVRVRRMMLIK